MRHYAQAAGLAAVLAVHSENVEGLVSGFDERWGVP